MSEKVIVRQDNEFRTQFWAGDPSEPESGEVYPVDQIHSLTPYGMMLAGLGSCTAIVLNTYSVHHGLDLKGVEIALEYKRVFRKDCEDCEKENEFREQISEEISLSGDLDHFQREKLLKISHRCPLYQMLKYGIEIHSRLAAEKGVRK